MRILDLVFTCLVLSINRQFTVDDQRAKLPLNVSAAGDITVIFYHARSTFGGKIQGKVRCENDG